MQKDEAAYNRERDPILRLARLIPVTTQYSGDKFFVKEHDKKTGNMRWVATPLFIVLIIVDTTDVIFATDSIPAIFAVTRDPFIVYTSNICAVLGLRQLYFLLAAVVDKFVYLKLGLSLVLIFIGAKMLLEHFIHIPRSLHWGRRRSAGSLDPASCAGLAKGTKPHLGYLRRALVFEYSLLIHTIRDFPNEIRFKPAARCCSPSPRSVVHAQEAGKIWPRLRTTISVQGTPDTGVITGHAWAPAQ